MLSLNLDGRFFFAPGLGIALSKHATRLVVAANTLEKMTTRTREALENDSLPAKILRKIARSIGMPVRLGIRYEAGQLIIYDKVRNLDLMLMHVLE
jgi:hypothetical protein